MTREMWLYEIGFLMGNTIRRFEVLAENEGVAIRLAGLLYEKKFGKPSSPLQPLPLTLWAKESVEVVD